MSYGARGYGNRGDYGAGAARGGFLSSLGRIAGGVIGTLGGPVGGIVGGAITRLAGGGPGRTGGVVQAPGTQIVPTPGIMGGIQRLLPGGQSGFMSRACLKKDGTPRRIRKDGKCWKRPTMNVSNSRAAGRAIRRIRGARKLLQRIESSLPRARSRKSWGGKKSCGCR